MPKLTITERYTRQTEVVDAADPDTWLAANGYEKWPNTDNIYCTTDLYGMVEDIYEVEVTE